MSYLYEDTTWSDAFNIPLGEYDTLEDSENYLGTQPCQTANPCSSPKRPHQLQPTASTSAISTWDYNASSSNSYPIPQSSSLPSLSWTSDASSSNLYRSSSYNPYPSPKFTTPLIEDDYTFFANVDLPPLNSNLFNATNPQVPHSPGPVVEHVSLPSTKRPHTKEESEYPNKASNDARFYHKRRRLSTNGDQDLPNVPPPTDFHNSSNVISDTFNNSNVSIDNDNALLANIDTSLYDSNIFIVTPNLSIPHAPDPVGHRSSPSRKRSYANEEPDFYNASFNPNPKRRRLSADGHKNSSTIPPASHFYDNSSNVIDTSNTVHNYYVPVSPASTSRTNAMLRQPYPNYNMFHHVSAPFMNIPAAPPVTIPPAYVPATQPGSSVPSQTINNYSADSNVYSNDNLYTAFPWDPLSYSTLSQPENGHLDWTTAGLPGVEDFFNNDATAAPSGPAVRTLVPPFLGHQVSRVPVPYNNGNQAHTDAFANNATHSGVDICQHSNTTNPMSTTGHTANARIPSACMPPTRAASSAESVLTFKFYHPTPSPPSPAIPTSRPRAPRKRCVPQPLPAMHFWERTDKGYRCLYDGPAAPNGCKKVIRVTVPSSLKNLGRHIRIHACTEDKMCIPEVEKIALNSLPDSLRGKLVTCSLDDGELHHCAYFRENGRRWEEETLERPDNLSRKHDRWNHPPHLRKRGARA